MTKQPSPWKVNDILIGGAYCSAGDFSKCLYNTDVGESAGVGDRHTLAWGRRTVTAALRQIGLSEEAHLSAYHHVLNRARWSTLALGRQLLRLAVRTFAG